MDLQHFAQRYAHAWSGDDPSKVAAFFSASGSLKVNHGVPAVGQRAITEVARGFMTAFPDIVVSFDRLEKKGERVLFHWTLMGTNTGPGGTRKFVRIKGYEDWRFDSDGLVAESLGYFDAVEYERQLQHGVP